jgi:Protein of unknown function (DUF433)
MTADPSGRMPCNRLEELAHNPDINELLAAHPDLARADVQACLSYAKAMVTGEEVSPKPPKGMRSNAFTRALRTPASCFSGFPERACKQRSTTWIKRCRITPMPLRSVSSWSWRPAKFALPVDLGRKLAVDEIAPMRATCSLRGES